jgi:hypothetical protein
MTQRRESVKIEVPKDESVRLGRVGLIALAGFVVGILWPRLAGMQLVPRAPVEDDPRPAALASAAPKSTAPEAAVAKATEQTEPALPDANRVKIGEMVVTSCQGVKDANECDVVAFDDIARTRLATLAACPAGLGSTGVLSIGFDLDFEKNSVSNVRSGQSTSLDDSIASKLIECASKEFKTATLAGVKHEHAEYTVFYKVEFVPEATPAEQQAGSGTEEGLVDASGRATVGWNVALIRKEPRDGEVVARVLSGTNVVVTGRQGDWYRVKYDGKGNEGWVYRSAIGL